MNHQDSAPMPRDRSRRPHAKRATMARRNARKAKRWTIGAALPSPAFA